MLNSEIPILVGLVILAFTAIGIYTALGWVWDLFTRKGRTAGEILKELGQGADVIHPGSRAGKEFPFSVKGMAWNVKYPKAKISLSMTPNNALRIQTYIERGAHRRRDQGGAQ